MNLLNSTETNIDILSGGALIADLINTTPGMSFADALQNGAAISLAAGGAEANFAVAAQRLGASTAFVGSVGNDLFGHALKNILQGCGVDVSNVYVRDDCQTRIAYIETLTNGDRFLSGFSTVGCADQQLNEHELRRAVERFCNRRASFLHFGSLTQLELDAYHSMDAAMSAADSYGIIISYDPNIRSILWEPGGDDCRIVVKETLFRAQIVKLAEDELYFLTGSCNMSVADGLREKHGIQILIITRGDQGAYVTTPGWSLYQPAIRLSGPVVDATGAGDAFYAAFIAGLVPYVKSAEPREALSKITKSQIQYILKRACAVGAMVCMRPGGIPAMPTREELDAFIEEVQRAP